MAKEVHFSDIIVYYSENPEDSSALKQSRVNNQIIFKNDCIYRYKPLITPILQKEHRIKMENYIMSQRKTIKDQPLVLSGLVDSCLQDGEHIGC